MTTENYNGWTNYATWRINLEMFDGISCEDLTGDNETPVNPKYLQELVEEQLVSDNETTTSYALAFIQNVNWYEIAEHINEQ